MRASAKGCAGSVVPILGFLGAWALHGTHNAPEQPERLDESAGCLGLIGSISGGLELCRWRAGHRRAGGGQGAALDQQQLIEEVQVGRLTPDEYHMLTSSIRRIRGALAGADRGRAGAPTTGWGGSRGWRRSWPSASNRCWWTTIPAWSYYDIQLLRARIDALKQDERQVVQPGGTYY